MSRGPSRLAAGPREVDALVARLPAEVAPPASVWARIEAGLAESAREPSALLARLPRDVAPPRDLWPGIGARLVDETGAHRTVWQAAAAAVGCVTLAALVGLTALRLSGPLDGTGTAAPVAAVAEPLWLERMDRISAAQPAAAASSLRGALDTIRYDYEMTQRQRLAIEAELRQNLDNTNLYAMWRHTYEAELALTSEAERILGNLR
jgi:hypothetical protein